jgi:hypothetical protein
MRKKFPEDSSGMVEGPDGPIRRTRANVLKGFVEPVESRRWYDVEIGIDGVNLVDREVDEFLG